MRWRKGDLPDEREQRGPLSGISSNSKTKRCMCSMVIGIISWVLQQWPHLAAEQKVQILSWQGSQARPLRGACANEEACVC